MEKTSFKLFEEIQKELPKNVLLVEAIADALDISNDAAYRRLKGKTNLSFDEALLLAKQYNISINNLYELSVNNSFYVEKKSFLKSKEGLINFYKTEAKSILNFSKYTDSRIIIGAKQIPIYHIPFNSLYSKFRVFLYLRMSTNGSSSLLSNLSSFNIEHDVLKASKEFKDVFKIINIEEVWSDATIHNCLNQLYYFYKINIVNRDEALLMCAEIKEMMKQIEFKAVNGLWNGNDKNSYSLYHNKLLTLNNMVYLSSENKKKALMLYDGLSHVEIEDASVCNEIERYFEKVIHFSSKISGNVEVARSLFFSSMYEKIAILEKQIKDDKEIVSVIW
ncbi:hypothetical protein WH52_13055 [Tenacibaculum holothuriorum]|uniref:HTH cro/C1-type domain-containing protein n=1 Tax=Tenacibaculum holothuriorum TaxID=1635173 RepID=A0A1Y2P9R5_9FLAO|nr:hypothetical protein [Tenacibaculum holothuriorum]OSY87185.1 hypothetical protein WH52_13055 [Tenacibaculum holothuriorum]